MKRSQIIKKIMVGVLVFCTCLGTISRSVYADSNSMTVSPPYQKVILTPGETYRNSLMVSNASGSTRDLKYAVEVGSFSQHKNDESVDDYGSVDHVSISSYNQIMDWIKIDKEKGTVAPGDQAEIGYTIEVPENAPAGGQYATILVIDETTKSDPDDGNVTIDQTFQFASVIYAEVAGKTDKIGEILDNSIPSFLLNGPLTAESMVKNRGNVHTDAEYVLQVWPLFSNEEICTNEEKPETSLILPDTERYHAQTCDLPSMGIFKAKQTIRIFDETSVVERTIIVCPLWLLFVLLFVIIALVIWIVMKVRGGKKRSSSSNSESEE